MATRSMRNVLAAVAFAGAASLALAACGSGGSGGSDAGSGAGAASGGVVTTHDTSALGMVYADSAGNTAYAADQEAGGTISCTAGCLDFWHPVLAGSASAAGLPGGAGFGTVKRPDNGQQQVTLKGRPLYTFTEDKKPGDTAGEGFKDAFAGHNFTWHALRTDGSAPAPSSSSSDSSGGGGYAGY
ncbi:COG4315 family predicted lipoprotein [Actinacidiphila bryophytorum]|uniref:Lipoprotein with Yx(FWY)xxD motif n=1 Tax=Actinacidiphila bryophytorum TaxID=1436133 RepID=A0A9W4H0V6_9ACTN|nr:hypothetical protein [Actinacidiphila bryophytorum]MBM9440020.1 hypothetical protein [Actinacidiphila bryophytorum]MBN6547555.1 hypothetical protein [Actinacidiphila bryophytorum]CAG7639675.1 conserved exported hypothetical protein [Actinacidiphila bryophytorum]